MQPPPVPPTGPGGDAARIKTGIKTLLDEAWNAMNPGEIKELRKEIHAHKTIKDKIPNGK